MQENSASIGDRGTAAAHQGPLPINVDEVERWASGLLGGGLIVAGVRRGPFWGILGTMAGVPLLYRAITGHCHLYGMLGISTAPRPAATAVPAQQGYRVEREITIERGVDEIFDAWRDLERLPNFMSHLISVRRTGPSHSHWIAKGPLGTTVEWDAETIQEDANRMISWRSLEQSEVENSGSVHFQPQGEGRTLLRVVMKYNPPAGKLGASVAAFLGEGLERQLAEDLGRFKSSAESGQFLPAASLSGGLHGGTPPQTAETPRRTPALPDYP